MTTTSIIVGIICLIAGVGIAWAIAASKASKQRQAAAEELQEQVSQTEALNQQHAEDERKQKQLSDDLAEQRSLVENLEKQKSEIKRKCEELQASLATQEERAKKLDGHLQKALSGNVGDVVNEQLAELAELKKNEAALKKKIKNLEDDIEEYEDDIASTKKKLQASRNENSELTAQVDKFKSENTELGKNLEDIKEQLADCAKDLKLRTDSIDFIQEILTAEDVYSGGGGDSEHMRRRHQRINVIQDALNDIYSNCISADNDISADNKRLFEHENIERWAITAKKDWIQNKVAIAFVGEFSAGKTSIVNRILSQDNPDVPLLPVSTKATTAIPTYITGGENVAYSDYRFISPDNVAKRLKESTFKKITKETLDQVNGISNLIKYFVMTYNNPYLNDISILDTPGFSSNDASDAIRTIDVINECDALFWVFDVNAGTINRSSIDLIRQNLTKPLYVVINKVDTKSPREVDSVESLIKKTLTDAGLQVEQYIRFSSQAPLDDIMSPIKSVKPDSFMRDYWNSLIRFLDSYRQECETKRKNRNKTGNDWKKDINGKVDQFSNIARQLIQNANRAASIPHWETHTFSKDRFEMTAAEGQQLGRLLEWIAHSTPNLGKIFDYVKDAIPKYNDCQSGESYWKSVVKQLDYSIKKIKKEYRAFCTESNVSAPNTNYGSSNNSSDNDKSEVGYDPGDAKQNDNQQGYAEEQYNQGLSYYNGNDVDKDLAKAARCFRMAAEYGHAGAQFFLGMCYVNGNGVPQDYNEAIKWLHEPAEKGDADAQRFLGWSHENIQDYSEAAKWYRKAAEQGSALAQTSLGRCYELGNGVAQDYNEAVKWYRLAAEQGLAWGQILLGFCYEEGTGVIQDYNEAAKWFRKAAEQGDAGAQDHLGLWFYNGQVVAQDYNEAAKWFHMAAEQNEMWAQYHLGMCYFYGNGVAKNQKEAVKWFRKAAEQGHADAQDNLGFCYAEGNGVAKNHREAFKWWIKAAEQGNANAQYMLGLRYVGGEGVPQNMNEAAKWFRMAAEQGHEQAIEWINRMGH